MKWESFIPKLNQIEQKETQLNIVWMKVSARPVELLDFLD